MKLQVTHRTRYDYSAPVTESHNEAHLHPTALCGQTLHSYLLKILPATQLKHYPDFYLNTVHFFDIPQPHTSLTMESVSVVTTTHSRLPDDLKTVPLAALHACGRQEECHDFLGSSAYVNLGVDVWRLAQDVCHAVTDAWGCALAIMRFVHGSFTYAPYSTTVHTPMLQVLEGRYGVCQDFAHVMIGMCRALKIPARYVSGYLYNGPTETLTGAQASHAWCEVYIPGWGWRALDPTNNCQADEHHVKVAVGRDYSDVVPIRGYYFGTPEMRMTVSVEVIRLDDHE